MITAHCDGRLQVMRKTHAPNNPTHPTMNIPPPNIYASPYGLQNYPSPPPPIPMGTQGYYVDPGELSSPWESDGRLIVRRWQ